MYKKCLIIDFYLKNVMIVNIKRNVDDDQEWMQIFLIEVIELGIL
jgi:hypothetical protein